MLQHIILLRMVQECVFSKLDLMATVQVLIWDVEAQPNRHAVFGATDSRPDLVGY